MEECPECGEIIPKQQLMVHRGAVHKAGPCNIDKTLPRAIESSKRRRQAGLPPRSKKVKGKLPHWR